MTTPLCLPKLSRSMGGKNTNGDLPTSDNNKTCQQILAEILRDDKGEVKLNLAEDYIHENGYQPAIDTDADFNSIWMDRLLVDFSLLLPSSPPKAREAELEKLRFASTNWGCFQVKNHGMSSSFLNEVRQVSKQFFSLPMEEKQKYARHAKVLDGYGNDQGIQAKHIRDWTDRLYLSVYPEEDKKPQFWPRTPENFSQIVHDYATNLKALFEVLLKAMATSLGLDDDQIFLREHGPGSDCSVHARFNYYPSCPVPQQILGSKAHSDAAALTFLLQDEEVEGLQVLKDDSQWFKVPVIPGAIFINVGDLIEIMSNGIFTSAVHRVVTNTDKERITLATFFFPKSGHGVQPVKELVTKDRPAMFKQVTNYRDIFFDHYHLGQSPLDAARIAR